jgi:hypothetical protein
MKFILSCRLFSGFVVEIDNVHELTDEEVIELVKTELACQVKDMYELRRMAQQLQLHIHEDNWRQSRHSSVYLCDHKE